jgi:hypothetical protein
LQTQELSGELGRVVIDKTGIPGRIGVALKWMPGTWSASHERWYKWLCGFRAFDLHRNSGITWTEIGIL